MTCRCKCGCVADVRYDGAMCDFCRKGFHEKKPRSPEKPTPEEKG